MRLAHARTRKLEVPPCKASSHVPASLAPLQRRAPCTRTHTPAGGYGDGGVAVDGGGDGGVAGGGDGGGDGGDGGVDAHLAHGLT